MKPRLISFLLLSSLFVGSCLSTDAKVAQKEKVAQKGFEEALCHRKINVIVKDCNHFFAEGLDANGHNSRGDTNLYIALSALKSTAKTAAYQDNIDNVVTILKTFFKHGLKANGESKDGTSYLWFALHAITRDFKTAATAGDV